MKNRVVDFLEDGSAWGAPENYVSVTGDCGWFVVTEDVAAELRAALSRFWTPRWVEFEDVFGSRIRIRARDVARIEECTREQRRRARIFDRALKRERDADTPRWDDD